MNKLPQDKVRQVKATLNGHDVTNLAMKADSRAGWIEVYDSYRRVPQLPKRAIAIRTHAGRFVVRRRLYGVVKLTLAGFDLAYADAWGNYETQAES